MFPRIGARPVDAITAPELLTLLRGIEARGSIETAKANGREPYSYLCWLFERLPTLPAEEIMTLAPWNAPA